MRSPRIWSDVTAVFGGSFNPPHVGHRQVIEGLFENPGVGRVIVVPSAAPPLKETATPSGHRLAMTQLMTDGLSRVEVSSIEIDRHLANPGPSYTYETILELSRNHRELAFVIGTDQLLNLTSWRRPRELLELCHWIVLERKPNGADEAARGMNHLNQAGLITERSSIHLRETTAPAVSSTQLREMIAKNGIQDTALIPGPVRDYIKNHRLYGA